MSLLNLQPPSAKQLARTCWDTRSAAVEWPVDSHRQAPPRVPPVGKQDNARPRLGTSPSNPHRRVRRIRVPRRFGPP